MWPDRWLGAAAVGDVAASGEVVLEFEEVEDEDVRRRKGSGERR